MPKTELFVATCRVDHSAQVVAWLAAAHNGLVPAEVSRLVCEYAGFFCLVAKTGPTGHSVVMHLRATDVAARQDDVIDGLTFVVAVPRFGTIQIDLLDTETRQALVTPWATELPQFMSTAVFLRPLRFTLDQHKPRRTRVLESPRTHRCCPNGEFYARFSDPGGNEGIVEAACSLKLTFVLGFAVGATPFGPGGLLLPGAASDSHNHWALVATDTEEDPCKLGWFRPM